jgi:hypothetical protein
MGTRSAVARARERPNESTRRQRVLRDALDVRSSLADFTTPNWWYPAEGPDERQHSKLWAASVEIEPSDLRRQWIGLSKAKQTFLTLVGVSGDLAAAANQLPPHIDGALRPEHYFGTVALAHGRSASPILAAHSPAGWYGVLAYLLGRTSVDVRQLWQATMFGRWGFVPDWCEYRRHWYFRPTKGRRPNACVLHQKAARQARYRGSPDQRRKKAEVTSTRKLRAR